MRTADERALAHNNKFRPLGDDFQLMTDRERAIYAEGKAEGRQLGFTEGAIWAAAQMLNDTATVYNRCETAARRFYAMDAQEAHAKATGVWR